jgi:transketolase
MPSKKIKLPPQRGAGLRRDFFNKLAELAKKDKDIMFLAGDLGYSFFEDFERQFPKQFINCGIAEQSIVGIAAGLAIAGKKPYCYSDAPFLVFRALEQIRDDVCYQNLNVKFISVTSKFLGFTHNFSGSENEEDVLKNLPNLKRYYPKTTEEVLSAMHEMYSLKSPAYLRL